METGRQVIVKWGIAVTGLRSYLMTFLAFVLVEAKGLFAQPKINLLSNHKDVR